MQIVLENSVKVGCAALRQTLNGWLQTFFTCNYAYSPVPGHPVYEISTKGENSCETGKNPKFEYLCSVDEKYEEKKPAKNEVSTRSAKTDKEDLIASFGRIFGASDRTGDPTDKKDLVAQFGRIFSDSDPTGDPTEFDEDEVSKMHHKFDRYMDKMNKSSKLAEGRQVVVITSNHELDIDFEGDVENDETQINSRTNNVKIAMRSRPFSLHQREPFQGEYTIKGISARTVSATNVPLSSGSGTAKWIAI